MKQLKVMVCGAASGQCCLEAVASFSERFVLAGFYRLKDKSVERHSELCEVSLYSDVDEVPEGVDIAYIADEDKFSSEEKANLAIKLLEKGINVILEQPIQYKDLVACLQAAKTKKLVFMVNDINDNLKAASAFVDRIKQLLDKQKPLYIDAALDKDNTYSFFHMLLKALPVNRPFEIISVAKELKEITVVSAKIAQIPMLLRIYNHGINNAEKHFLQLSQRVSIGVEGGNLLLAGANGPIIWETSIPDIKKEGNLKESGCLGYLFENNTEVIWKSDTQSYKQIFFSAWTASLVQTLHNMGNLIQEKSNINTQIQSELLCASYWSKLISHIDEKKETIHLNYLQFPAALLRKTTDQDANKLMDSIDEKYLTYCVSKRDNTIYETMLNFFQKNDLFIRPEVMHSSKEVIEALNTEAGKEHVLLRWLKVLTEKKLLNKVDDKYCCKKIITDEMLNMAWNEVAYLWNYKLGSPQTTEYLMSNIEQLPYLINGEQKATFLLFPEGNLDYANALYKETLILKYLNSIIAETVIRIGNNIFSKENSTSLKILEIGAGTGATTDIVLEQMHKMSWNNKREYMFTDVSTLFLQNAKERYRNFEGMQFQTINIDKDFKAQGLESESTNIIISVGVLNNAYNTDRTIAQLLNLLSQGGWLLIIEPVIEVPEILISQAFMMTPPEDDRVNSDSTFMSKEQWREVFSRAGATEIIEFPEDGSYLNLLGQKLFMVKK